MAGANWSSSISQTVY